MPRSQGREFHYTGPPSFSSGHSSAADLSKAKETKVKDNSDSLKTDQTYKVSVSKEEQHSQSKQTWDKGNTSVHQKESILHVSKSSHDRISRNTSISDALRAKEIKSKDKDDCSMSDRWQAYLSKEVQHSTSLQNAAKGHSIDLERDSMLNKFETSNERPTRISPDLSKIKVSKLRDSDHILKTNHRPQTQLSKESYPMQHQHDLGKDKGYRCDKESTFTIAKPSKEIPAQSLNASNALKANDSHLRDKNDNLNTSQSKQASLSNEYQDTTLHNTEKDWSTSHRKERTLNTSTASNESKYPRFHNQFNLKTSKSMEDVTQKTDQKLKDSLSKTPHHISMHNRYKKTLHHETENSGNASNNFCKKKSKNCTLSSVTKLSLVVSKVQESKLRDVSDSPKAEFGLQVSNSKECWDNSLHPNAEKNTPILEIKSTHSGTTFLSDLSKVQICKVRDNQISHKADHWQKDHQTSLKNKVEDCSSDHEKERPLNVSKTSVERLYQSTSSVSKSADFRSTSDGTQPTSQPENLFPQETHLMQSLQTGKEKRTSNHEIVHAGTTSKISLKNVATNPSMRSINKRSPESSQVQKSKSRDSSCGLKADCVQQDPLSKERPHNPQLTNIEKGTSSHEKESTSSIATHKERLTRNASVSCATNVEISKVKVNDEDPQTLEKPQNHIPNEDLHPFVDNTDKGYSSAHEKERTLTISKTSNGKLGRYPRNPNTSKSNTSISKDSKSRDDYDSQKTNQQQKASLSEDTHLILPLQNTDKNATIEDKLESLEIAPKISPENLSMNSVAGSINKSSPDISKLPYSKPREFSDSLNAGCGLKPSFSKDHNPAQQTEKGSPSTHEKEKRLNTSMPSIERHTRIMITPEEKNVKVTKFMHSSDSLKSDQKHHTPLSKENHHTSLQNIDKGGPVDHEKERTSNLSKTFNPRPSENSSTVNESKPTDGDRLKSNHNRQAFLSTDTHHTTSPRESQKNLMSNNKNERAVNVSKASAKKLTENPVQSFDKKTSPDVSKVQDAQFRESTGALKTDRKLPVPLSKEEPCGLPPQNIDKDVASTEEKVSTLNIFTCSDERLARNPCAPEGLKSKDLKSVIHDHLKEDHAVAKDHLVKEPRCTNTLQNTGKQQSSHHEKESTLNTPKSSIEKHDRKINTPVVSVANEIKPSDTNTTPKNDHRDQATVAKELNHTLSLEKADNTSEHGKEITLDTYKVSVGKQSKDPVLNSTKTNSPDVSKIQVSNSKKKKNNPKTVHGEQAFSNEANHNLRNTGSHRSSDQEIDTLPVSKTYQENPSDKVNGSLALVSCVDDSKTEGIGRKTADHSSRENITNHKYDKLKCAVKHAHSDSKVERKKYKTALEFDKQEVCSQKLNSILEARDQMDRNCDILEKQCKNKEKPASIDCKEKELVERSDQTHKINKKQLVALESDAKKTDYSTSTAKEQEEPRRSSRMNSLISENENKLSEQSSKDISCDSKRGKEEEHRKKKQSLDYSSKDRMTAATSSRESRHKSPKEAGSKHERGDKKSEGHRCEGKNKKHYKRREETRHGRSERKEPKCHVQKSKPETAKATENEKQKSCMSEKIDSEITTSSISPIDKPLESLQNEENMCRDPKLSFMEKLNLTLSPTKRKSIAEIEELQAVLLKARRENASRVLECPRHLSVTQCSVREQKAETTSDFQSSSINKTTLSREVLESSDNRLTSSGEKTASTLLSQSLVQDADSILLSRETVDENKMQFLPSNSLMKNACPNRLENDDLAAVSSEELVTDAMLNETGDNKLESLILIDMSNGSADSETLSSSAKSEVVLEEVCAEDMMKSEQPSGKVDENICIVKPVLTEHEINLEQLENGIVVDLRTGDDETKPSSDDDNSVCDVDLNHLRNIPQVISPLNSPMKPLMKIHKLNVPAVTSVMRSLSKGRNPSPSQPFPLQNPGLQENIRKRCDSFRTNLVSLLLTSSSRSLLLPIPLLDGIRSFQGRCQVFEKLCCDGTFKQRRDNKPLTDACLDKPTDPVGSKTLASELNKENENPIGRSEEFPETESHVELSEELEEGEIVSEDDIENEPRNKCPTVETENSPERIGKTKRNATPDLCTEVKEQHNRDSKRKRLDLNVNNTRLSSLESTARLTRAKTFAKEFSFSSKQAQSIDKVNSFANEDVGTVTVISKVRGVMQMFKTIRGTIRKKYMKFKIHFSLKQFHSFVDTTSLTFTSSLDDINWSSICSSPSCVRKKLYKMIVGTLEQLKKNGIVDRIFGQHVQDMKKKLWKFMDDQFDYLFDKIKSVLVRLCDKAKLASDIDDSDLISQQGGSVTLGDVVQKTMKKCQMDTSSKFKENPVYKSKIRQLKSELCQRVLPIHQNSKKHQLKTTERTKSLPLQRLEQSSTCLHHSDTDNGQGCSFKASLTQQEKEDSKSQNNATRSDQSSEIIMDQETTSLTFNFVNDDHMGDAFKSLLQDLNISDESTVNLEKSQMETSTPETSITELFQYDDSCLSPEAKTTHTGADLQSKLLDGSSSPVTHSDNSLSLSAICQRPINPDILDESCMLEVPTFSSSNKDNTSCEAINKSFVSSILMEDLAVSSTVPSPLKSDGHLSFLRPDTLSTTTPEEVIKAHYSEDALLEEEDATEQDIHLALESDNSSSPSSCSSSWANQAIPPGFQYCPSQPMQAVIMEKSNDHFVVKIRRAPPNPDEPALTEEDLFPSVTENEKVEMKAVTDNGTNKLLLDKQESMSPMRNEQSPPDSVLNNIAPLNIKRFEKPAITDKQHIPALSVLEEPESLLTNGKSCKPDASTFNLARPVNATPEMSRLSPKITCSVLANSCSTSPVLLEQGLEPTKLVSAFMDNSSPAPPLPPEPCPFQSSYCPPEPCEPFPAQLLPIVLEPTLPAFASLKPTEQPAHFLEPPEPAHSSSAHNVSVSLGPCPSKSTFQQVIMSSGSCPVNSSPNSIELPIISVGTQSSHSKVSYSFGHLTLTSVQSQLAATESSLEPPKTPQNNIQFCDLIPFSPETSGECSELESSSGGNKTVESSLIYVQELESPEVVVQATAADISFLSSNHFHSSAQNVSVNCNEVTFVDLTEDTNSAENKEDTNTDKNKDKEGSSRKSTFKTATLEHENIFFENVGNKRKIVNAADITSTKKSKSDTEFVIETKRQRRKSRKAEESEFFIRKKSSCKKSTPEKMDHQSLLGSPSNLSAKNVIKKKGEVIVTWSRDEDRLILLECQKKGPSEEAFASLANNLKKDVDKVSGRFHQLMKLFKKAANMS